MKYKVSNCPSFVLMRTATSGTYFDMCGNAKGHIKCADCTDCVIKQVIEKCRAKKLDIYNPSIGNEHYAMANSVLSTQILQLFDI